MDKNKIESKSEIKFDAYRHEIRQERESPKNFEEIIANLLKNKDYHEIIPRECREYTGFSKMSNVYESKNNTGTIIVHFNYYYGPTRQICILYHKIPNEIYTALKSELELINKVKS